MFSAIVPASQQSKSPETGVVPPHPPLSSPITFFRQLLATNEAGRNAFLATKSPAQRQILESKLKEYLNMPTEQREIRLFMTELRWYLISLLQTPKSNRQELLAQIPSQYKPLLEDRLKHWDKLPLEIQRELLENEVALHYILQLNAPSSTNSQTLSADIPALQKSRIDSVLKIWNSMPDERRKLIADSFKKIFELNYNEIESSLKILPPAEKIRMENTLSAFAKLPKEEREKCIASFEKFANMSKEEREQFLRNAARWIEMTPEERAAWRNIVRKTIGQKNIEFPPLPPGLLPEPGSVVHSSPTNISE